MIRTTTCDGCGADLSDCTDLSSHDDLPCPHCGSLTRTINIKIFEAPISVTDYMSAIATMDGRSVSFRESERQGRVASADENDDGSLSYILTGTTPQGEEDTVLTCRILIQAMNAAGATWGEPTEPKMTGIADCISVNKNNNKETLEIQVVRAVADKKIWAKLAKDGRICEQNVDKNDLIEMIKDSINIKASEKKIPFKMRSKLVLALDATRVPVLVLDIVSQHCKNILGNWISSLGFQSVWLVGPKAELTWQLDDSDPTE